MWRQLIDEVGLNDGRQLSTGLQRITTQQVGELADFCVPQTDGCQLLWSPRPKIPRLGKMDIWLTFASWPQIWAGSAHVMVIDWDVTYEFSRIVGDEWSCFGGAVRIYWPELF